MQLRFKKVGNILKNERETFIKSRLLKLKNTESSPRNANLDPDNLPKAEMPHELI